MEKNLQRQHVKIVTIITANASCGTAVSKRHLKTIPQWDPAPIGTSAGYKRCGVGVGGWGPIGGLVRRGPLSQTCCSQPRVLTKKQLFSLSHQAD